MQASLTLEGVEALLYLFTPKSQRPLKVPLRMHRKYTAWPLPSLLQPRAQKLAGRWSTFTCVTKSKRSEEEEMREVGEGFLRLCDCW